MIRPHTDSRGLRLTSPTITIFDLEYTAWECSMARHWLTPGELREVVQIGAVRLDADSFAILDTFEALVVPRVNPVLSPYFEKLTGITSRQLIRDGMDFSTAYAGFLAFAGEGPIAAYGRDDPEKLIGAGLSDLKLGLRVRYEWRREIAPYLGVRWVSHFGDSADFRRAAGEDADEWLWLAGIRAWF